VKEGGTKGKGGGNSLSILGKRSKKEGVMNEGERVDNDVETGGGREGGDVIISGRIKRGESFPGGKAHYQMEVASLL